MASICQHVYSLRLASAYIISLIFLRTGLFFVHFSRLIDSDIRSSAKTNMDNRGGDTFLSAANPYTTSGSSQHQPQQAPRGGDQTSLAAQPHVGNSTASHNAGTSEIVLPHSNQRLGCSGIVLTEGDAHNRNGIWEPPLNVNIPINQVAPSPPPVQPDPTPTFITQTDLAAIEGTNYRRRPPPREPRMHLDPRYCALKAIPRAYKEVKRATKDQYRRFRHELNQFKLTVKERKRRKVRRSDSDALRGLFAEPGPEDEDGDDDTESDEILSRGITAPELRARAGEARHDKGSEMEQHAYEETSRGVWLSGA